MPGMPMGVLRMEIVADFEMPCAYSHLHARDY